MGSLCSDGLCHLKPVLSQPLGLGSQWAASRDPISGPLEEQQVLLMAELFFSPHFLSLGCGSYIRVS